MAPVQDGCRKNCSRQAELWFDGRNDDRSACSGRGLTVVHRMVALKFVQLVAMVDADSPGHLVVLCLKGASMFTSKKPGFVAVYEMLRWLLLLFVLSLSLWLSLHLLSLSRSLQFLLLLLLLWLLLLLLLLLLLWFWLSLLLLRLLVVAAAVVLLPLFLSLSRRRFPVNLW